MLKEILSNNWHAEYTQAIQHEAINAIENGNIIFFPQLSFTLSEAEQRFLSPGFAHVKAKNISFNRSTNKVRCAECSVEDYENLKLMMQRYSEYAEKLVRQLFSPYAQALQVGRTSYRPIEIAGRKSSYRKDDTRLHVDAFPATPNHGRRILRVFTNVNPDGQDRVWRVGESFTQVASQFLPGISQQFFGKAALLNALRLTKTFRTEYDHIMLQIHDRMKANMRYQKTATQQEIRFAPATTWIVQTDHVSHAAMSGQYVLEQTFYLPVNAMVNPDLSPLRTLERMMGKTLT